MTEIQVIETQLVATAQPQASMAIQSEPRTLDILDIRAIARTWAVEDRLPFDPFESDADVFENCPTVKIGQYDIPVVSSLTTSEDWYFSRLIDNAQSRLIDTRGEFGELNQKAQRELKLEEGQTIFNVIYGGGDKGLFNFPDGREGEFIKANREEIDKLQKAIRLVSNDFATRLAKIWFFLASRCNSQLEPTQIPRLVSHQKAILALIDKEANDGKDPDPEPTENTPDGNGGVGKALSSQGAAPNGETSTGNSTQVLTSETNGLVPDDLELNLVG
jgi:hypothetical protein